jgi:DNA-binding NarL/FixJ family response regulator
MDISAPMRAALVGLPTVIQAGIASLVSDAQIVGTYKTVEELQTASVDVDVVIMDARGPSAGYVTGAEDVAAATDGGFRVLLLSGEHDPLVLLAHLSAGAAGVVFHRDDAATLAEAIQEVSVGRRYVSASSPELRTAWDGGRSMTPMQRQMVFARADRETFRAAAARLGITQRTAEEFFALAQRRLTAEPLPPDLPIPRQPDIGGVMTAPLRFPDDLPDWGSRKADYEHEPLVTRTGDGFTVAVTYHHTVVTIFMTNPELNYAETTGPGELDGEQDRPIVGGVRDTSPAFLRRLWQLGYPFRVFPIVTDYEASFVEDGEPTDGLMWTE